MKIRRLVLDRQYALGAGLGDIEGLKLKVRGKIDWFDKYLSPDGRSINEDNVVEYDWEEYFTNPYYFDDQADIYSEMWKIADKVVDEEASEQYFISLEEDSINTGWQFVGIWLEDVTIRGDEVIFTMTVDIVYHDNDNSPWW